MIQHKRHLNWPLGNTEVSKQAMLLALLVLCLALGATYALWRDAQNTILQSLNTEFNYRALDAADMVKQRMSIYDQALLGLGGLFAGSVRVERDEFHHYVEALDLPKRFPGLQGLGFIQQISAAEKAEHIAAIRQEGFPDYLISPSGQRELYTPVVYVEPFSGRNLRDFGYDTYSEPMRRAAIEQASLANRTTLSAKLALTPDNNKNARARFLMLLPVHRQVEKNGGSTQHQSKQLGWVYSIFSAEELMTGILGKSAAELDIEIFDGETPSVNSLLYDNDKIFRAGGKSDSLLHKTLRLQIAGRVWTLLISSLPAFEQRMNDSKSVLIAQSGSALSLLLALISGILAHSRERSLQFTSALQRELAAREKAEESLRLAALVYENSSEGMLVTDAANRILAINPAFTLITGYELGEALGKDLSFFSSGQAGPEFYQAILDQLAITGQWQGEIWDQRKNGDLHAKYLTINTAFKEDGSVDRRVALLLDITEKKESEEFIWRQANFDTLTQLPNRSMFHDRLVKEILKARRTNTSFALLFIDLDLFKEVNDALGHHVGDLLLMEAATRIIGCVREVDMVSRLGGDEFTIILPELHEQDSVERVAGSILQKLAEPYRLGEEVVHVSGSIGITLYPRDADDADSLLKNADQAMYVAKNLGRHCYSYYTPALQAAAQARLRLITDLRAAIVEQQFSLHYQSIVNLATGEIYKAEALIRWHHPERGLVSPAEFIPLAEETGLIISIGDWVFKEAAQEAMRLRKLYHPAFQISVNKSPKQFREASDTYSAWRDHLQELGLPGNSIIIEITEGLLLNAVSDVTDRLKFFREGGMQIAIDDFGTGYSSLAYLKRFHIDYLKIDQSFVRDIETDNNDLALSNAIIVMAHALGLKVIAEGVETEGQLKLLTHAGCDYAQGYYFSKPIPADQFEELLLATRRSANNSNNEDARLPTQPEL